MRRQLEAVCSVLLILISACTAAGGEGFAEGNQDDKRDGYFILHSDIGIPPPPPGSGFRGLVLFSPRCSYVQTPCGEPDQAIEAIVTVFDPEGLEVADGASSPTEGFTIPRPAGTYELRFEPDEAFDGGLSCPTVPITVTDDSYVGVSVFCVG